jgi:16S rRNA (uracil1498-N3)-methyltransferase
VTLRAVVVGLSSGASEAPPELVRYVCVVHRIASGAPFVAFDPTARLEADAHLAVDGERAVLHVGPLRTAAVVATRSLSIVQGFAKADKCDAIVRDATELGATALWITTMARSVARPVAAKRGAREERWRRIAAEAARQCGRGDSPRVAVCDSLDAALRELAPSVIGFVLWENAKAPLGPALVDAIRVERPLAFVVGPEGGLTDHEVATCRARGFEAYSLGPFVLRTETVVSAVLGAVRVLEGVGRA